jgi:head-tail adaptor
MSYLQLLQHELSIIHRHNESDGMGGFTDGTDQEPTLVRGRVSPASVTTQTAYQALGVKITHTVYLESGIPVEEGNRLRFGIRCLLVKYVKNPEEGDHHLELQCEEVR